MTTLLIFLALISTVAGKNLSTTTSVGTGTTVTSQQYKVYDIDSLDLFEKDTSSISDEYRIFLDTRQNLPLENWKLDNNIYAALSNKSLTLRERFSGNAVYNQFKLSIRENLEVRLFDSGKSNSQSYLKNNLYLKGSNRINNSLLGYSLATSMENKIYTQESSTGMNYNLFRIVPSLDYENVITLEYVLSYRNVPDSLNAEYFQNSFNLVGDYYTGLFSRLTGALYYDMRKYPDDTLTGYSRFYSELSYEFPVSSSIYLRPYYEYENYMYDHPSFVRVDYSHHTLQPVIILRKFKKSFSYDIGTGFECLFAKADSSIDTETYNEFSIPVSVSLIKSKLYYIQANCSFGQRFYETSDDTTDTYTYQSSDYTFVTLDMILNYNILPKLRFSLIGSLSPEWHKVSADDFNITFISASLRYTF